MSIQLQNFVSLTTTQTSGLSTLTNGVLNVPNYSNDWIDYSATSTIVGWSSFTIKIIRYRIIGKQLFYQVCLSGTSNNINTTFTLPNSSFNTSSSSPIRITNNGTNAVGLFETSTINSTVNCYTTVAGAAWTASGTKTIFISSFIEIA